MIPSPVLMREEMGVRSNAQRVFKKLRVSLTRSCNFVCPYCAHDGKPVFEKNETPVGQFIEWIQKIIGHTSIEKIRLTGGEPTLYTAITELVNRLTKIIDAEISMTTNGHALLKMAAPLQSAGLRAVNISLDAIDEDVFRSMGGRSFRAVIAGILHARDLGLQVKLNSTLMREMNENQILPLLQFARTEKLPLRFLELMQMGHLQYRQKSRLVSAKFILDMIRSEYNFTPLERSVSDTAQYFRMDDGYQFGIVGNASMPFCSDCDRLRLDATGRMFGCLSSANGIALSSGDAEQILQAAMALKQPLKFIGSALVMREVGG